MSPPMQGLRAEDILRTVAQRAISLIDAPSVSDQDISILHVLCNVAAQLGAIEQQWKGMPVKEEVPTEEDEPAGLR